MTPQQKVKLYKMMTGTYYKYNKGMNSYSFFKVNNKALSDDLVQEAFLKTWRYLAKGKNINMMKSFLYHVLRQLIIDEYRKKKNISLDLLIENGYEPSTDNFESFTDMLDGRNAILLIQKLPIKYQKIIYMKYVQNLSIKEISTITKQSKNTVGVQIHRGLKKLKDLYVYEAS